MILIAKQFASLSHYCYKFIPLIAVFLTACTFNQQLTTEKNGSITNPLWINHQQQLVKLTKFQTRGAFAYIGPDNKTYAKFFWQQYRLSNYRLLLTNPLGTTELELNVTPGVTQLMDREGKKYVNHHPAQMIYQLTGMEIPIENLPYWLIGLPTNATSFTLDENGLLKTIEYRQNGETWHLNYLAYHQDSRPKLPSQIELTQGKQGIKLKMDSWTLNE
ncbi:lipoprotein insertase outer membrane protein LolB [Arsenophonus endosymbiont of Bemisia tabaci]|uniref:lipoprotein insertase outer membrane protein LolB n=1 Tax=Arsenophonus endosymbiont of Bemisia tabaci TaxID=536059 RepID=UPI0015F65E92|nr:lipoprotein insertase outer membrane protein LolB [Arsenophonus endosymbiont of Bemisia tabaci]CAA2929194.1 Outer-membrane lipoprotein LolB [Arsenophonus endosymbiont of Bemisia tabaci Q2]